MKQFVITFALFLALFAHSYGYVIPDVFVAAYDDNFYMIRIPNDPSLSSVSFYINDEKPLKTIKDSQHSSTVTISIGGVWEDVFGVLGERIEIGNKIHYIVAVTKDGVRYTTKPATFEVEEILPKADRPVQTVKLFSETKHEDEVEDEKLPSYDVKMGIKNVYRTLLHVLIGNF